MKALPDRGAGLAFALVFLLALALRLQNAATGSLKLDDFHTLHHASAGSAKAFLESVRRDNHPPLAFLAVALARALLGESPWALRLPALLAGLGALFYVDRLAARTGCRPGRTSALLLIAVSSLHVELSSDVRMYALLALASAGLIEALLGAWLDGKRALWIALWSVVGLHAHYHFVYVLVAVCAALLVGLLREPALRAQVPRTLRAFGLAALVAAPWYALVFPSQLAHGLAPGGSDASLARLAEGFKSLVFWNVSVAGGVLRGPGLVASALFLLAVGWGVLALLKAHERPLFPLLLAAGALGVPLLSWLAAHASSRAGFEWRYLAGALPALCVLAGHEACAAGLLARVRRLALRGVIVLAGALAWLNACDPGEEDYRGAVATILAECAPGDAVLAADWQPTIFPHAIGWSYYAPRLASGGALPELLAYDDTLSLADPGALAGHARVFCCLRSLPNECGLLRALRAEFGHERVRVFGRSVFVHVFTRT